MSDTDKASLIDHDKSKTAGSPLFERRPWGSFTVLDEGTDHKVKRIEVLPGKRLSYQKHSKRAEHWTVVAGAARVTIDGEVSTLYVGDCISVPVGAAHRIENPAAEPLALIEVQMGPYLGEDDIVRLQDDFGRTT
ncbi:MAG TPA: phosphomannose isomerase type II C-terminal cupin domain [Blastocatellia bacterium]